MSERFHLAVTASGSLAIVLAVLLAPQASRGDFLALLLLVTCVVVIAVTVAAELTAPRTLVITPDAICVRSLVGISCVAQGDIQEVLIERAPLWRGGDRIAVRGRVRDLLLPVGDEALERLSRLAHTR